LALQGRLAWSRGDRWNCGSYRSKLSENSAVQARVRRLPVGKDVSEAIFERTNCTTIFCDRIPKTGVRVRMGRVLDRGNAGPVHAPASYFMKHPPRQLTDDEAHRRTEAFICGESEG
jgi:myo-inositol-1-phosphate synthase